MRSTISVVVLKEKCLESNYQLNNETILSMSTTKKESKILTHRNCDTFILVNKTRRNFFVLSIVLYALKYIFSF